MFIAATSPLPVSHSPLLAALVAAAALLLLRMVGRLAPMWVRRPGRRAGRR